MRFPAGVLASVVAAAAQTLSPFQFAPGDAALQAAAANQQAPAIARGGSLFLAVWQDNRGGNSGQDIYAARLDAAGKLIDVASILVTQAAGDQTAPRVVWNGQNWLVVWASQTPTQYYWAFNVQAARVSPQGVVLDSQPLTLSNTVNSSGILFAAASDGANWAVVWEGTSVGEADIRAGRISPTGVLLDPGGVAIVAETYYLRFGLELAFASGQYLLLWNEWRGATSSDDILSLRLSPALQLIDTQPRFIAATLFATDANARAASNGAEWFVVWEGSGVKGTRVNAQGIPADPGGKVIATPGAYGPRPVVDWDGTNWFVAWQDNTIKVARVSAAGAVLDPGGAAIDPAVSSYKSGAGIAGAAGGGARVVWQDDRAGGYTPSDIFLAAVSANNVASPGLAVSQAAPSQLYPRLATTGSQYMLVYLSMISGSNRVMAQPLDAGGLALSPAPVQLAAGPALYTPGVAWNGSVFLVSWTDAATNRIYARRIQPNGTPLDAVPILVMPGSEPDVAANGDTFLVVGTHAPSNPELRFTFAARVSGAGAVLGAPVQLGQYFATHPRVGAVGGRWLAVWERHFSHDDPKNTLNAAFVLPGGAALPEFVLQGTASYYLYNPAIAASADTALVVWEDPRVSNSNWNIYGKRVKADGTVLDGAGITVSGAPNNQGRAAAGWDGAKFVVAFDDRRANALFFDMRTDVFAARVDGATGLVLDPNGFAVASAPTPETLSAVAGASGSALIAAGIFRPEQPYTAFRAGFRTLDYAGNKPPAAVAGASPRSGPVPLNVGFTSSASWDPDGTIASHLWNFGDGTSSTLADPAHLYAAPGSYIATLAVTDNAGATSSTALLITPLAPASTNQPPVAVAAAQPSQGNAPLAVNFSSAGSHDPDGSIAAYAWNFGDGTSSAQAHPSHTYTSPGVYTALLKVTDNQGAAGAASTTVTAMGVLRSTGITMWTRTIYSTFTIYANVTVKDAAGAAVPGAVVTATWTLPGNLTALRSATTAANGVAAFSIEFSERRGTFTITINDIAKPAYTFDKANSVLSKSITRR